MPKAYLRKRERLDLIQFIASRGEGYKKYLEYANKRNWSPLFTEQYYHTWVNRHRKQIWEAKDKVFMEIRSVDNYDRKKRIDECEQSILLIDDMLRDSSRSGTHLCPECDEVHINKTSMIVSLLEQKRKYLEQIAKERNEWGKENSEDVQRATRQGIRGIIMEKLSEAQEATILDGKVVVVRDEGSV